MKHDDIIRLARPRIPPQAIAAVHDVLGSGDLVQGKRVAAFEEALAAHLGTAHCVAVSSGTAALHLSLMALGVGPGDEVVVPAFTFPATANVVELVGARPVLVDIGLPGCTIDAGKLEAALSGRTKAIMPVHEFGAAAPMNQIVAIAARHGVPVIEDAACAIGTRLGDRAAGAIGLMGCFSFHPRKILTTGEGGAIVTADGALARSLAQLRNHGMAVIDGRNEFVSAGLNYRMSEMAAAIGAAQLDGIEDEVATRRGQAGRYGLGLAGTVGLTLPFEPAGTRHTYQTYHIMLDPDRDRDGLIRHLAGQGIQSNIGAHALHCLRYYRERYGYAENDFPAAARAYRCGVAVPLGQHLCDRDIERVCGAIRQFMQ